jgi:two-component system sporulation sensor kinase A
MPQSQSRKFSRSKAFLRVEEKSFLIPMGELELFHYMIDQIGDQVMVIHKGGRIVFANQAAIRKYGYSSGELIGKSIVELLHEKMTAEGWRKRYFNEVKKKRKPVSYVIDRLGRSGEVYTVDVTAVYMPYKSEEYVLSVARDITEKMILQKELEESEYRYRLLSEQAVDGTLLVDPKGVVLYANNAAGLLFRCHASKLVGSTFLEYIHREFQKKAFECFKGVTRGQLAICDDIDIVTTDGNVIPAEFTASPVYRDDEIGQVHMIIRNVTRRKELEHLQVESEKMKALQNFIAGTAKEIQQPLKGILEHSHRLVEKYKDMYFEYIGYKEFKDIMTTLAAMRDRVRCCFDTTNRLLDINKRKINLRENYCHVNAVIKESIAGLQHSLEASGIKCDLRLSAGLPLAAIGAFELNQAITNILTNAIQAMPRGGEIRVRTMRQNNDGRVRIDCRDDGLGIPPEALPHVFEPFFTTKHRGLERSSGLGLSIVYSLIKARHGDIVIKSKLRQGTLVQIYLPVYKVRKKTQ